MGFSILVDDASPWILSCYGTQWVHDSDLDSALGVFNNTLSICHTEIQNTTYPLKLSIDFYGEFRNVFFPGNIHEVTLTRPLGSEFNLYGQITSNMAMNYTIDGTSLRLAVLSSDAAVGKVISWRSRSLSRLITRTFSRAVLPILRTYKD